MEQIKKVAPKVDESKLDVVAKDKKRLIAMRAEAQSSILDREVKRLR